MSYELSKNYGVNEKEYLHPKNYSNDPMKVRQVKDVLKVVFEALQEKGYNPVNQIVGYIMSGDPTYITSYKNARSMIMKVERDELVEELLKAYIRNQD